MKYIAIWLLIGWFNLVAMSYDDGTNAFSRKSSFASAALCIVLGPILPLVYSALYVDILMERKQ